MKDNAREFIIKNLRQALSDIGQVQPKAPAPATDSHFRLAYNDDMVLNFVNRYMVCGGNLNYAAENADVANLLNPWIMQKGLKTVDCSTSELSQYLKNLNLSADNFGLVGESSRCGVLLCDALVAWNGSVVVTSSCFENKEKIVMPENTVMIAFSSQVTHDLKTFLAQKGREGTMPQQIQVLYPENIDHTKNQILLIEDQN